MPKKKKKILLTFCYETDNMCFIFYLYFKSHDLKKVLYAIGHHAAVVCAFADLRTMRIESPLLCISERVEDLEFH